MVQVFHFNNYFTAQNFIIFLTLLPLYSNCWHTYGKFQIFKIHNKYIIIKNCNFVCVAWLNKVVMNRDRWVNCIKKLRSGETFMFRTLLSVQFSVEFQYFIFLIFKNKTIYCDTLSNIASLSSCLNSPWLKLLVTNRIQCLSKLNVLSSCL